MLHASLSVERRISDRLEKLNLSLRDLSALTQELGTSMSIAKLSRSLGKNPVSTLSRADGETLLELLDHLAAIQSLFISKRTPLLPPISWANPKLIAHLVRVVSLNRLEVEHDQGKE